MACLSCTVNRSEDGASKAERALAYGLVPLNDHGRLLFNREGPKSTLCRLAVNGELGEGNYFEGRTGIQVAQPRLQSSNDWEGCRNETPALYTRQSRNSFFAHIKYFRS